MANSPAFVAHALDLLSLAGPVLARPMFGGHGVYHRGTMFALLDDDELFLKTDDETRDRFVAAGCVEWVYAGAAPGTRTRYFRPPDDAHEEPEAMLPWARLAIDASVRAAAAKARKKRPSKSVPRPRKPRPRKPARGASRRRTR